MKYLLILLGLAPILADNSFILSLENLKSTFETISKCFDQFETKYKNENFYTAALEFRNGACYSSDEGKNIFKKIINTRNDHLNELINQNNQLLNA